MLSCIPISTFAKKLIFGFVSFRIVSGKGQKGEVFNLIFSLVNGIVEIGRGCARGQKESLKEAEFLEAFPHQPPIGWGCRGDHGYSEKA